jgi:heme oxygenase (biliverdin-IX-beta and delta-forming)
MPVFHLYRPLTILPQPLRLFHYVAGINFATPALDDCEGVTMILTRLKQKTLLHHERLEKRLDLFHSVKTFDDYRLLLGKFLGFYEPAEEVLEATFNWSAINFDFTSRKKTPLLMRDLHSLGIEDTLLLPRCKTLPGFDTMAQAFGCLYVFESATLGWGIVMKHLSRTLGVTRDDGGLFFNSYGDRVVAMWHDFAQQLRTYASRPDIEDAIVIAAVNSLVHLDQWMASSPAAVGPTERIEAVSADDKAPRRSRQDVLRLL